MILYFSATGNSEHVARRIAAATDDKVVSIERFDVEALRLVATEGPCQLGFVAPVYAWGLPTPMIEFLKTADLSIAAGAKGGERPYTFYVSTYGSTTGQSAKFARDLLHEKKILITRGGGFNWAEPDHFRIVYLPRMEVLKESLEDLADFFDHYRQN